MALHHINGDGKDNRLSNLELLCPNCHAQTENFAGRNRCQGKTIAPARKSEDRDRLGALLLSPRMRILRRLLPIFALLVLALALTGCGGDDGDDTTTAVPTGTSEPAVALSKEELISQGDGICAEVNAAVGTVGSTSSGAEGQAAQVAGLYEGMVERLQGLGAPSDDSAGYAEFISAAEALAQAEDDVKLASEREEAEALSEAEAEASSALAAFESTAASFGFEQCAEAPAAPVPSAAAGEAGEEAVEGVEEEGGVEAAPEEEAEAAPEEGAPVEEEGAGGGAGVGGGTEGGGSAGSGGSSGGVGPG